MAKRLAVILIDKFADWEHGYLTSTLRDFLGGTVGFYTPMGADVTSEGGMVARSSGRIDDLSPSDFDALAVIGSSVWSTKDAPDIAKLVELADKSKKIVGFICQGTLAAARAGLLDERPHTSNDADTPKMVATYQGAAQYLETPRAVRDGNLITSAGSSPVTFAVEILVALHPEREKDIRWLESEGAKEFSNPASTS